MDLSDPPRAVDDVLGEPVPNPLDVDHVARGAARMPGGREHDEFEVTPTEGLVILQGRADRNVPRGGPELIGEVYTS